MLLYQPFDKKVFQKHLKFYLFTTIPIMIAYYPEPRGRSELFFFSIIWLVINWAVYRFDLYKNTYEYFQSHNHYLKWTASIYPGVATVVLLFAKETIFENTQLGVSYLKSCWLSNYRGIQLDWSQFDYSIDYWTTGYFILFMGWLVVYIAFVSNEHNSNKKNTEANREQIQEVRSTILRAPNPEVFSAYNSSLEKLCLYFSELEHCNSRVAYELCFRSILKEICVITSSFVNKSDNLIYGSNIMLYIPTDIGFEKVDYLRTNTKFFHFTDKRTEQFNGVLRLINELVFSGDIKTSTDRKVTNAVREIPSITIPILNGKPGMSKDDLKKYNLPGASVAAIAREFILHDVLEESNYKNIGIFEKRDCLNYWRNHAPDVRSVISLQIPYLWREETLRNRLSIVGVLNIDCSAKELLGNREAEYQVTFFALIFPILNQLSIYVKRYLDAYLVDLDTKMSGNQPIGSI